MRRLGDLWDLRGVPLRGVEEEARTHGFASPAFTGFALFATLMRVRQCTAHSGPVKINHSRRRWRLLVPMTPSHSKLLSAFSLQPGARCRRASAGTASNRGRSRWIAPSRASPVTAQDQRVVPSADAPLLPPRRRAYRMGMPSLDQLWTRAQVLALPDDGQRYELVDGELLVEVWTPEADRPAIADEKLAWQPETAPEPLKMKLEEFFGVVRGEVES